MSSCLVFSSLKVESFHDVFSLISRILTIHSLQPRYMPVLVESTQPPWYWHVQVKPKLLVLPLLRSYFKELITISLVLGTFRQIEIADITIYRLRKDWGMQTDACIFYIPR